MSEKTTAPPATTKALKPVDQLRQAVVQMQPQFKMGLPPHISPEKFVRVVQTAINNTPALVSANRQSFFSAAMKAAQDGLLPDGKEAALVTFGAGDRAVVQYMPMVAGILKKVRNSGELSMITAHVVYEHDTFQYWIDTDGEHIDHTPQLFGPRGQKRGAYALAKTKDGAVYIEFLTVEDVMAIKNVSRSKNNGPWSGDFEPEMWKKSAIRRLSKRLPMSTDLEITVHADDELFTEDPDDVTNDVTPAEVKPPAEPKANRLKNAIKKNETASVDTPPPEEQPAPTQAETQAAEESSDVPI